MHFNRLDGVVSSIPVVRTELPNGGLLCEEMGLGTFNINSNRTLGKTVELIALILAHPSPSDFEKEGLISSDATLIITPSSIICQWHAELSSKAPGLKLLLLDTPSSASTELDPVVLSRDYDVVLITYEVLKKQIYRARPDVGRQLRGERRYERKIDPFTSILWWRVIMDEVQMVKSVNTNASEMAGMLPAFNKWGASG
jgi:E3 ubiquitin-protein ligase SHPRH